MTVLELREYIHERGCTYDELASLLKITKKLLTRKLGCEKGRTTFNDEEINNVVELLKDRPIVCRGETHHMKQTFYRHKVSKELIHEDNETHWIYQLITAMGYTLAEASIKLGHSDNYLSACIYMEKIGKRAIPAKLHDDIMEKL